METMINVPPGYSFQMVINSAFSMVDNPYIEIFLWAVIADMATGMLKATKKNAKRHINSTKGLNGTVKHSVIILLVLTLYPLADALGFTGIANVVLLFYLSQYSVSLMENLNAMGIPFPEFITSRFEKMKFDSNDLIKKEINKNDKTK